MSRDEVLQKLRTHVPELQAEGILHLALFGSTARNEAGPESDVDLMAEYDPERKFSLLDISRFHLDLEDILGTKVDLANRVRMRPLSMPSKHNPIVYLEEIRTAIDRVQGYVAGLSFDIFEELVEKQDAVLRRLSVLSEAVDRLRATGTALDAKIDWAAIHNFGNVLRHEDDSVDLGTVWKIMHEDLPVLQQVVKDILRKHFPEAPVR